MDFASLLAQYSDQAEVTSWPARVLLTVLVLGVTAVAVLGMWRGWHRRAERQQEWVGVLPPAPEAPEHGDSASARYVASVRPEQWQVRITAASLGAPGNAIVYVWAQGVLLQREGENNIFLPAEAIKGTQSVRGMAQEVYERDGVLAVTWQAAGGDVITGLRFTDAADQTRIAAALNALAPPSAGSAGGQQEQSGT